MSNPGPAGPLGHLAGMYFDPDRNRYFPLAMRNLQLPLCPPATKRKRAVAPPPPSKRTLRLPRRSLPSSSSSPSLSRGAHKLASATMQGAMEVAKCPGEGITSLKSYAGGLCVTTDHGEVILVDRSGERDWQALCSQPLLGVHFNPARSTVLAVANGNDPHAHSLRHTAYGALEAGTLDFPQRDLFAMSSFDDVTSLGSVRSVNVLTLGQTLGYARRRLPSDPLALHQASRDVLFAGLRSSAIVLEDLRVARQTSSLATLPRGKAVTAVKRLSDSAVPFGILAAGLDHQLVLFDARFSRSPLRTFKGHVNVYHTNLAVTTSPDDTVVLAGGSDRRLRAWNTVTGEQIQPANRHRRNVLNMDYRYNVKHVDVDENWNVRVASAGDVLRFE